MLPPRILTGIAIVLDVAMLARGQPVAAKVLAERQGRPPRHLEALLQNLVRHGFLKGTRGPRGGYELARERRRISLGAIVRCLADDMAASENEPTPSGVIEHLVLPALAEAEAAHLQVLDTVSVQDVLDRAKASLAPHVGTEPAEFHI